MLIYHDSYKAPSTNNRGDSLPRDVEQSTSRSKTPASTLLTRANANFLRSLGFRVRQYKKLKKNE